MGSKARGLRKDEQGKEMIEGEKEKKLVKKDECEAVEQQKKGI